MSEIVKNWTEWLKTSRFSYMSELQRQQTILWLCNVRDKILERAGLKEGDTVLDIGTGTGLLGFGSYVKLGGKGRFILSDAFADCVESCKLVAEKSGIKENLELLVSDASDI